MKLDDLDIGGQQILQHLGDRGLGVGEFALAADLVLLFDTPASCETAEAQLEAKGLVTLGPMSRESGLGTVRSASLTEDGWRLAQTPMQA